MATIVKTAPVGPGTLKLGDTTDIMQIECQLTSVKLTPSVDTEDAVNTLCGGQAPGAQTETWTLNGTILQDEDKEGVMRYIFNNRNKQVPFELVFNTERGVTYTGTVTISGVEIGGDVKTNPTTDFEWNLIGAPEIDDNTPAEPPVFNTTISDKTPMQGEAYTVDVEATK